jgi:hypothetical protein
MLGWLRDASRRASRSKRARRSIRGQPCGQHLDRDVAAELRVGGTHATGADGGGDAVMGAWLADHSRLSQRRKPRSTTSISSASHSPISAVIEARGTLTTLSIMT